MGFLSWARDRFGAANSLDYWRRAKAMPGPRERTDIISTVPLPKKLPGGHEVRLRVGTTDQTVYDQIFLEEEYQLDVKEPKFIIDAGAHVGMTSMYFAIRYPNATIVAIEPERFNWRIAKQNLAPFKNVHLLRGALWNRETHLGIGNPDASPWGFRMVEDLGGKFASEADCGLSIPGFTVEGLMRHFGRDFIDIFKLDVEGSEVEVLPTVPMDKVGLLACETHDRHKPGCTEALRAATPGWKEIVRVETHILTRPD